MPFLFFTCVFPPVGLTEKKIMLYAVFPKASGFFGVGHKSKMMKGTSTASKCLSSTCILWCYCGFKPYYPEMSSFGKCAYPAKHKRKYTWNVKARRQDTSGTSWTKHLKRVHRRLRSGFHEGATPEPES